MKQQLVHDRMEVKYEYVKITELWTGIGTRDLHSTSCKLQRLKQFTIFI